MSALAHFADSSRSSAKVREVPKAVIGRFIQSGVGHGCRESISANNMRQGCVPRLIQA
jgi:hypothetical protein